MAIPRGPSLDPKHRRLAVHVEDHPIEYFDFEGVIPNQQYGAGDVIVWDWGRWTGSDTPDATKALRDGELKLALEGEKLRGAFVIVRMAWSEGGKDQWLLIKRRDDAAVAGWDPEDHPESVKTGRTNDDVAARRRPKRTKRASRTTVGRSRRRLPSADDQRSRDPVCARHIRCGRVPTRPRARRPVGRVRDGGRYPGTLPRAMRVSAVGQAALLAALAVYVLSAAGLVPPSIAGTLPWLIWAVVAFSALSLVLNAITPEARGSDGSGSRSGSCCSVTSLIVALGV